MIGIDKYCKNVALSLVVAGGVMGFAMVAQAHDYSQAMVRTAQQQLKHDGYYKGSVDGIDGPATQAAIRDYQRDNNLKVNGELDRKTRDTLGVNTASEASRSTGEANRYEENAAQAPSSAAISAAQRKLQQKGFFKGDVDGHMGAETRSALREYQKNSNLNVTGRLDQATLSSLGVSK